MEDRNISLTRLNDCLIQNYGCKLYFCSSIFNMKKYFSICVLVSVVVTMHAQKKTVSPIKNKPATVSPLKTLNDSASYAIGISVANFYKQQGLTKLNTNMISKAITDVFGSKQMLLDDAQANTCIMNYMNMIQENKSRPAIDAGRKFLADNKKKPGVITTASGLQYEVIKQGSGPKPTVSDSVVCHYRGMLLNGTEFENSYTHGQPITFLVGGVIRGWSEALQLMPVGSKYKLYVPYQLGYGASDYGPIPGGSMLTFEVELLEIKAAPSK